MARVYGTKIRMVRIFTTNYDDSFFGTLDNGSDACRNCIKDEEEQMKKREKQIKGTKEN